MRDGLSHHELRPLERIRRGDRDAFTPLFVRYKWRLAASIRYRMGPHLRGFVEIEDSGLAKALKALDGYEMDGRSLKVNEAQDKPRTGGGSSRF